MGGHDVEWSAELHRESIRVRKNGSFIPVAGLAREVGALAPSRSRNDDR